MSRAAWILAAATSLSGGGCALLFGLDEATVPPADAPPAPPPDASPHVTGTDQYLIASHGAHATAPVEGVFVARTADGAQVPTTATIAPDATELAFDIPPGAPFILGVSSGLELQTAAREFHLGTPYIGRFDAPAMTKSSTIALTLTQAPTTATTEPLLQSTGVRALAGVAITVNPIAVDYHAFSAVGAAPIRVPSGDAGDALSYVRLSLTTAPPTYFTATDAGSAPFTLADGAVAAPIAIAAAPIAPATCFALVANLAAEAARIGKSIAPAEWPMTAVGQWQLLSVPDADVDGPFGGLLVARSNYAALETDFTGPVCYTSPFAESEVALMYAIRQYQMVAPGAAPAATPIAAGVTYYLRAGAGVPAIDFSARTMTVLAPPVLAGTALATAHQEIALDRAHGRLPLELPVGVAGDLAPDDYTVVLYELATDGMPLPTTTFRVAFQWIATAPRVLVDPKLLVAGHVYVFAVGARHGYAAAPDYRHPTFPYATATTFSEDFVAR